MISKMLCNGIEAVTMCYAAANIMSNTDIVMIQYNLGSIHLISKIIECLIQPQISAILHGAIFELKDTAHFFIETKNSYTLITGGTRGMGAEAAKQVASQGRNVIITGRPGNKQAEKYVQELKEEFGVDVRFIPLDLNDYESIKSFPSQIQNLDLTIDTIIHNAAVGSQTSVEQTQQGSQKQNTLIKVNSIGPVQLQNALEEAGLLQRCNILVVSSVGALRPFPEFDPIDLASKQMLESWIHDLSTRHNVITIYPGATDTDMFQKSTTNSLKASGILDDWKNQLPKKMIADPKCFGYLFAFLTNFESGSYLNGSKIAACCGMHIDYKNLPNTEVNKKKNKFSLVDSHFECEADLYNSVTNPKGKINFGTSMNRLIAEEVLNYLPSHLKNEDTKYSKLTGSDEFRQLISKDSIFNDTQTIAFNNLQAAVDALCFIYKEISIFGTPPFDLQAVLDHSDCKIVKDSQSKCRIIFQIDLKPESLIDEPQKKIKTEFGQQLLSQLNLYNLQDKIKNTFICCPPIKSEYNISFIYEKNFSANIQCGVILTKDSELYDQLEKQTYFFPVSTIIQSAALLNLDPTFEINDNIYSSIKQMYPIYNIPEKYIKLGTGASSVLEGLAKALFKEGDLIGIEAPFYSGFLGCFGRCGSILVDSFFEGRISLLDRVKRSYEDGLKGYIICNPNNPTGYVYSSYDIVQVCEWAQQKNFHLIFDEMYQNSLHESHIVTKSALEYSLQQPNIHVVHGFAKDFGLCGIKIGILISSCQQVLDKFTLWKNIQCPHSYVLSSIDQMLRNTNFGKQVFDANINLLGNSIKLTLSLLDQANIPYFKPQGGVFVWIDLRIILQQNPEENEYTIWSKCFLQYGLSISIGQNFHSKEQGFFRICTVQDNHTVIEGIRRLEQLMKQYQPQNK